MSSSYVEFEQNGASRELIVMLHAYMSKPKKLDSMKNIAAEEYPDADFFVPKLPTGWVSMARPTEIIQDLLDKIDVIWKTRSGRNNDQGYEKIILIGHSIGALFVRKLYICACGEIAGVPLEAEINAVHSKPWASKVERVILLAGMNRGWRVSHHLSLLNAIFWSMGNILGNLLWLIIRRPPLIFTIKKGAPFITQLRIHWIYMRNAEKWRHLGNALTIQLLGSIDDMVSPEDNIDLISGRDFIYLDVPNSGHANVIKMDDPKLVSTSATAKNQQTVGETRAAVFRDALIKSEQDLIDISLLPSDLPLEEQRHSVTDVIFVIHGIRDLGYWTHKVARRIQAQCRILTDNKVTVATETSSYGYFPMLPFFMPRKRREKVEWLMDQYTEALGRYPNAEFSFIGHSNGTYLLTRALRDYPVCKFKHVVLAGSVVRTRYNWSAAIARKQVKKVLNYVATADWVVAFFPRAVQMLHLQDLGSAGHDGFNLERQQVPVSQIKYIKGGHAAALNEANWDAIAHFILTGEPQDPPDDIKCKKQSLLVKLPGLVAPLVWVAILSVIFLIYHAIWLSGFSEAMKTLLAILFTFLLWKVVTVV